jgi:hypothetical protein
VLRSSSNPCPIEGVGAAICLTSTALTVGTTGKDIFDDDDSLWTDPPTPVSDPKFDMYGQLSPWVGALTLTVIYLASGGVWWGVVIVALVGWLAGRLLVMLNRRISMRRRYRGSGSD